MGIPAWALGPFIKDSEPVLAPGREAVFHCPVAGGPVRWQASNVYNPAAVVREGRLHLLFRADDEAAGGADPFGNPRVTCRIGHAVSDDGVRFTVSPKPVLFPDNDACLPYEWPGGCQDLHIVEGEDGRYYMNYTAWNGLWRGGEYGDGGEPDDTLLIASSDDLLHWTKHGPAFDTEQHERFLNHSRSGAVLCRPEGHRMVAARLKGRYWMYMSHRGWLASSADLIRWEPELDPSGRPVCLFPNYPTLPYANASCEAGAGAVLTGAGIVYLFNASWRAPYGGLPAGSWGLGQALVDAGDLMTVRQLLPAPFLLPEAPWERRGHCAQPAVVCNAMVRWRGRWNLYYGAADRCIGHAAEG